MHSALTEGASMILYLVTSKGDTFLIDPVGKGKQAKNSLPPYSVSNIARTDFWKETVIINCKLQAAMQI